ncbi:hypothetical protein BBK14_13615 [Parafrankia soli]|uniref:Uncharacterized protein n=1 Tax=Parafrankia soli TaxID=2599596 RepID=A0A1S1R4N8_9ACTN|nr:hypothetical protein [Parafrankia soli]OHV39704.1 hypothetical protein BBK14_13615 [Parafrankia soli]
MSTVARTRSKTSTDRRVRDTGTGRTGRARSQNIGGGISIGAEHGPCDRDGRPIGRQLTTVTWDDGTKDSVPTDTLDTD